MIKSFGTVELFLSHGQRIVKIDLSLDGLLTDSSRAVR
jgi:hypothetical protein